MIGSLAAGDPEQLVRDLDQVRQAQIANVIVNAIKKDDPNSSSSIQELRTTVLAMEVEEITLGRYGSQQWLITGTSETGYCGTGGCTLWVIMHDHNRLRVVLSGFGWFNIEDTIRQGMHDISLTDTMSATMSETTTYRWTGTEYHAFRCSATGEDGKLKSC